MTSFYDQLTPFYHLVYPDWNASVRRQGEQLSALIAAEWPGSKKVLDVSCGIGTQAIGLALQGLSVRGSDLSEKEVERAKREASQLEVAVDFSVCDMRGALAHHGPGFDAVLSCDNSLPHLLTDEDLLVAFREMAGCISIGGGCLVTVRDYEKEERGKNLVKPYGVRIENGYRYLLFQVWDFEGQLYDLTFFFVVENLEAGEVKTHAMRSRYYAVSTSRLCELMEQAGLKNVRRLDGVYFQPVLVGTRAA
ncbi:class I SAM-dependent methyltransferase [Ottowia sp.]|uniref:class I SAM-dependent methyltransferase n=1 Tax=Ottowia sp. TaxID=1898956 RepID=UPI002605852F|nr:class I SAM-dependent methyltransferase [Ottowia sp.]